MPFERHPQGGARRFLQFRQQALLAAALCLLAAPECSALEQLFRTKVATAGDLLAVLQNDQLLANISIEGVRASSALFCRAFLPAAT